MIAGAIDLAGRALAGSRRPSGTKPRLTTTARRSASRRRREAPSSPVRIHRCAGPIRRHRPAPRCRAGTWRRIRPGGTRLRPGSSLVQRSRGGRSTAGAERRRSRVSISASFQALRWSCQVPRPMKVTQRREREQHRHREAGPQPAARRSRWIAAAQAPFLRLVVILQSRSGALSPDAAATAR